MGHGSRRAYRSGSRLRCAPAIRRCAPKGRLNRLEKKLVDKPWRTPREGVEVKLLAENDDLYVFAQSADRENKERAMRRRQLKRLWARLKKLATMQGSREEMLMKLGATRSKTPSAWRLVPFSLDRNKQRTARRREGREIAATARLQNHAGR